MYNCNAFNKKKKSKLTSIKPMWFSMKTDVTTYAHEGIYNEVDIISITKLVYVRYLGVVCNSFNGSNCSLV